MERKNIGKEKYLGQIYTPKFIVNKILDDIGFMGQKKFLDPACGDGRFIGEALSRSEPSLIHGWDIDPTALDQCKLNHPTANLSVLDSLKSNLEEKFDFIAGNPPYVRIQNLSTENRTFIQDNYSFCKKGSTDLYMAFFELCYNLLSDNGICGLITPNSFMFTETAKEMRKFFSEKANILQITNYGDLQLFDNVTTYSAITIFKKKPRKQFLFQRAISATEFVSKNLESTQLTCEPWQLSVDNLSFSGDVKLKDICKIHVGLTTLCDKAYIFDVIKTTSDVSVVTSRIKGEVQIETGILKTIIKASKSKVGNLKYQYILFPYEKNDKGKHVILPEDIMKQKFPLAYNYLLSIKDDLDKRDKGKINKAGWYAFGRSQGLDTVFGKKIIFSPMNKKPNFIFIDEEESCFYSGYCIKYNHCQSILPLLNSVSMQKWVEISSRCFRGGWKSYNKKSIENFPINKLDLWIA